MCPLIVKHAHSMGVPEFTLEYLSNIPNMMPNLRLRHHVRHHVIQSYPV